MNYNTGNFNGVPAVKAAEEVLNHLSQAVNKLKKARAGDLPEVYAAFLHGQAYGLALALRLLYPGPGNWGEKAALLVRPVITEHKCECEDSH
ncbi:hypothetical protein IT084_10050 [Desulfallas sp. Bu1-1]|jgi:LAO/AO transport system kinase|uniref:hypothetical protein n=1 Tax=Desulfallas sp. Bu1-1 TaxID=2787620 RepID=UPI00189F4AFE|nr:hypothetical protein [Desulfallas sp. Bu1-1]MBF7083316.1 hypothetical protein [Desulfallas sp. Bu1-1]